MIDPTSHDLDYVCEHVRVALATDGRVSAMGIDIRVVGDSIVLDGDVSSPAQRRAVGEVAAAVVPAGVRIVNEVEVAPSEQPDGVEEID